LLVGRDPDTALDDQAQEDRYIHEALAAISALKPKDRRLQNLRKVIRDILVRTERRGEAAYIYVNNRLEGNAPTTIHEILEEEDQQNATRHEIAKVPGQS
jgi:uncharacterized protein YecE (DUF72 family)